jgi:DNA-binding PadR family transcriptional regulator
MTGQYAAGRGCGPELLGWLAMAGRHGHGHGRGRHRGGPPGFGGPFGFGGPGGPFGRGGRARRGDVRAALLTLLAEEPRNGYQLMQEIERRSDGVWRPSPGSVYPALQQLEDEGLVRSEESDGSKRFALTDAGREAATAASAEGAPWDAASESVDADAWELFGVARQVGMAIFQIAQVGTAEQLASAREVLTNARRSLYGILAEDEEQPPEEA